MKRHIDGDRDPDPGDSAPGAPPVDAHFAGPGFLAPRGNRVDGRPIQWIGSAAATLRSRSGEAVSYNRSMRIVFAGTPEFAAQALKGLVEAAPAEGWSIPLVLTQPDRPAGRGMSLTASPVRQLAQACGISIRTPASLSLKKGGAEALAEHDALRAVAPDVLVVAAYGLILPQAVLDIPKGLAQKDGANLTAANVHASLLPRWRGAAPIARAIEAGDRETGVTIMQMEAGLDTGPMLLDESVSIRPEHTTATLTADLAALGARLIVEALRQAQRGQLQPRVQPEAGVTYAHKIEKREAWLDFTRSAAELARQVRAFDPFPVASARLGDEVIRIWRAQALEDPATAQRFGAVLAADAAGIVVATGAGALRITELQRAGGKRLAVRDFLAGSPVAVGASFAPPPAPAA
jgi:methionyl-tRNA formyltransferase